jgi:hypothetical protein
VVLLLVARSIPVTDAPGTTAPVLSVTVPTIVPLMLCAFNLGTIDEMTTNKSTSQRAVQMLRLILAFTVSSIESRLLVRSDPEWLSLGGESGANKLFPIFPCSRKNSDRCFC